MDFYYRFPVVKGIQAGKTYYIGMVPLKTLSKLFSEDEDFIAPEHRAQRKLNESRIPEITRYILENRDSYVFSALAASIDGKHRFIVTGEEGIGILEVDMNARFLINDGQHRKAAIITALEEDPDLGEETISVVFYEDRGLERSQQMFTDLNKHAVKTSNSIAELYDHRDPLAVITRKVISDIDFLNEYVDKERDNLGKYSSALFALNTFYKANRRILAKKDCNKEFEAYLACFWSSVVNHMVPWKEVNEHTISKKDLREQYIATQAVIIQALGRVGYSLYGEDEVRMESVLNKLEGINWRRNCRDWIGRVIRQDGKMLTSNEAISLAGNIIKNRIGISLSEEEAFTEEKFNKR